MTIYDIIQNLKSSSERVLADSNDITEVRDYLDNKFAEPNEDLFGVAEGKNVIKIHLESFQSFLIDYELNGEERSEEHTSELQSRGHLVCRLLLEKKK